MKKIESLIIPYNEFLCFQENPCLIINNYKWENNGYYPVVQVFLCHNNKHLKVKFIVFESNIRCVEKKDNGRICCDSCVEFFVRPFEDDKRYLNFEINPIGAAIFSIGGSRNNRIPLVMLYKNELNVKTKVEIDYWLVEFEVPFQMLKTIFDKADFVSIKKLYGNFYKCGDETEFVHYGMWNEIESKNPDFHSPKFFGELIIK